MNPTTCRLQYLLLAQTLFCGLTLFVTPVRSQGIFNNQTASTSNLILTAPRQLTRLLREAEVAIQQERYADGISALGAILNEDSPEAPTEFDGQDFFLPGQNELFLVSIKSRAGQLLSRLPASGRTILETQFGVTAKLSLDEALASSDMEGIVEVTRKFPHTQAAYQGMLLLAQDKLAHGYPIAAANIFEKLLTFPYARELFGPELARAAVVTWLKADKIENAERCFQFAISQFPSQQIAVDNLQFTLDAGESLLPRIRSFVDAQRSRAQSQEVDNWLTSGGNAARNAVSDASLPLKNATWKKNIDSSVPEKRLLQQQQASAIQNNRTLLPKFEARVTDQLVLTKTTDAEVLAIDLETGRVKWPFYRNSAPAELKDIQLQEFGGGTGIVSRQLNTRVWASTAFGRFSCGRDRMYLIDTDDAVRPNSRGRVDFNIATNLLQAISLSGEGKIDWQVGGNSGQYSSEPALKECFFLGPPLEFEGQLYVIGEQNGETKLFVLDPQSGRLIWFQQLVDTERQLRTDFLRRSQALSPIISNGVIVCPTGAGAIVALDATTRQLKWSRIYSRPSRNNALRSAMAMSGDFSPTQERWHDDGMIINEGVLVASPVDSDRFFACDLMSGRLLFNPKTRNSMSYVAGIKDGRVFLVGDKSVRCFELNSGSLAWEKNFPNNLKLVAKGLWLPTSLMVAVSNNTILEYGLQDGDLRGQLQVENGLGNLLYHQGNLLSVSATDVSAYSTQDQLRSEVELRLANNPEDAGALIKQAELQFANDDLEGAFTNLSRALTAEPEEPNARHLMIETLLAGLKDDFETYVARAADFDTVVEGPRKYEYWKNFAIGSLRSGKPVLAFDYLVKLLRERTGIYNPMRSKTQLPVQIEANRSVEFDNWIASELVRCYEVAEGEDRTRISKVIRDEIASVQDQILPLRRRHLKFFKWHPEARQQNIATAIDLREQQEHAGAESLLIPLSYSTDASTANVAAKLLSQRSFEDNVLLGPRGRSLEPILPNTDSGDLENALDPVVWNQGAASFAMSGNGYSRARAGFAVKATAQRFGRPEISFKYSSGLLHIQTVNGESIAPIVIPPSSQSSRTDMHRVHLVGGVIVFETLSELMAFDLYRALARDQDTLLWRYPLFRPAPGPNVRYDQRNPLRLENIQLGVEVATRIVDRESIAVGPVTPGGIVIKQGSNLVAVDLYSGRQMWERNGYDNDLRLAAHGLEIAVVNPAMGEIEYLDCRDGQLIRKREYTGNWRHWYSHNKYIIDYRTRPNKDALIQLENEAQANLRIWSPFEEEVTELPFNLVAGESEGRYLAAMEKTGKLHVWDLESGMSNSHRVPVYPGLKRIHLKRFGKRLVVFCDAVISVNDRASEKDSVNGHIYACDLNSGELSWDHPGELFNLEIPASQPTNSPYLIAYRLEQIESPVRNLNRIRSRTSKANLAVVDLRNGKLVAGKKDFTVNSDASYRSFSATLRPRAQRVEINIGATNIILTATSQTPPPRPIVKFGH